MSNFFKKISSGTKNFFKKVDSGASNFFKKLPDTVSNVSEKVGDGLRMVGGKIADASGKAGNFLEKNSQNIAMVGAGLATAIAPEFAPALVPAIMAAGTAGQALGGRLRQGGQLAKSGLNNLARLQSNVANKSAGIVSGLGRQALGQARIGVNSAGNTIGGLANEAQSRVNNASSALQGLTLH